MPPILQATMLRSLPPVLHGHRRGPVARALSAAFIAGIVALLCGCGDDRPATGAHSPLAFTLTTTDGHPYPLSQLSGKVVLLVNTASHCVFTSQYKGLEALYLRYQARGLVIVAVPSDDFFGQEPGTDPQIHAFCTATYGITFPLMAKAVVSGDQSIPLYHYLTRESPFPGSITWNFNKFLVGRDGVVVARFGSHITPDDPAVVAAVEAALGVAAPAPAPPR